MAVENNNNIMFQEPGVLEYIGNKEKMINIYISIFNLQLDLDHPKLFTFNDIN